MKKILLAVGMCVSSWGYANVEKNQAMYDMMLSMAMNSPDNEMAESAKCLGVSEDKLSGLLKSAMQRCFEQNKNKPFEQFVKQMETCVHPAVEKKSGFSAQQIERCKSDEELSQDKLAELDDQIDELNDQLDSLYENDASDAQVSAIERQLDSLEKRRFELEEASQGASISQKSSQRDMQVVMQVVSQASEKSLHLITLPLYQNSKIMVHMSGGAQMMGKDALPAATFASVDSVDDVLAFYRKKLPKFAYKNLGNGEHILMESMPKDFDMMHHMDVYMNTPHVLIRSVDSKTAFGVPKGTKSNIEVSYRERS